MRVQRIRRRSRDKQHKERGLKDVRSVVCENILTHYVITHGAGLNTFAFETPLLFFLVFFDMVTENV
jgi:hypothetical protein